jgi:hypothetical protein
MALALAVNACGDAFGPPITLTTTEVNQLFGEVGSVLSTSTILSRTAPGLLLSRVPMINVNQAASSTETFNCAGGGTATITGSAIPEVSVDADVSFSACKTTHWTLDGSFHEALSVTTTNFNLTLSGTMGIKTADGSKSGSCTIDYKATTTLSGGTGPSTVVTGTVCGVDAKTVNFE